MVLFMAKIYPKIDYFETMKFLICYQLISTMCT